LADFSMHVVNPIAAGNVLVSTAAPAAKAGDGSEQHHFSFNDFLDIINPLQHIPIVSTLYRKITGDTIGTPEKILGDTLYGGLSGLASSVADAVFEKVTGKNFGDTVLALLDGGDKATALAANAKTQVPDTKLASIPVVTPPVPDVVFATAPPTSLVSAAASTLPASADKTDDAAAQALTAALNRAQFDPALAARARYAYNRATAVTQPKLPDAAALAY
jgi:hypothetical protein